MQHGLQRQPGFKWLGYTTLSEEHRQRMDEIKRDPDAMAEVHALAKWLLKDVV